MKVVVLIFILAIFANFGLAQLCENLSANSDAYEQKNIEVIMKPKWEGDTARDFTVSFAPDAVAYNAILDEIGFLLPGDCVKVSLEDKELHFATLSQTYEIYSHRRRCCFLNLGWRRVYKITPCAPDQKGKVSSRVTHSLTLKGQNGNSDKTISLDEITFVSAFSTLNLNALAKFTIPKKVSTPDCPGNTDHKNPGKIKVTPIENNQTYELTLSIWRLN